MWVFPGCYEESADGWSAGHEERIIAHLKQVRLPCPERNALGPLARDWASPHSYMEIHAWKLEKRTTT